MSSTLDRPSRLGRYEILARIAKGGMAEIFLARQKGMVGFSKLVVVKRILPHMAEDPVLLDMFMQEARLAALINHPNVVQIHDVGQYEGSYFIAMEYIEGASVAAMCRLVHHRRTAIPFPVAGEMVAQVCDGLHAAHELTGNDGQPVGLVHRDISPQNLMVSSSGQVKVLDFGIAKARGSQVRTDAGQIKGKYPYMSPEQCEGGHLTRCTDIFSLGIVFYEMVVAKRLFKRRTELATMKAITEETLPLPHEKRPDLPLEISRIILRALERRPERRFADAAELGRTVRRTLADLGHPTNPSLLADYLRGECAELLEARASALRRVQRPTRRIPSVLDLDGLDEETGSGPALPTVPDSPSSMARERGKVSTTRKVLLLSLLVLSLSAAGGGLVRHFQVAPHPSGPPLTFGLPPSFPAAVGLREFRPLLDYLEERVGRRIELTVAANYRELSDKLLNGEVHVAMLPALQYVLARSSNPALRVLVSMVHDGTRSYQGYIIARDKDIFTSLAQLQGHKFCYVDTGSTSGYLLARFHFREKGLDPDQIFSSTHMSGNHIKVMRDVLSGRCDAGAIYSGALLSADRLGIPASQLKLVAITGKMPYDIFAVSPELKSKLVKALREAFLGFKPEVALGRKNIGETFRISGFVAPSLEEFRLVEQVARSEGMIP